MFCVQNAPYFSNADIVVSFGTGIAVSKVRIHNMVVVMRFWTVTK